MGIVISLIDLINLCLMLIFRKGLTFMSLSSDLNKKT